jgi:hypothetical protein
MKVLLTISEITRLSAVDIRQCRKRFDAIVPDAVLLQGRKLLALYSVEALGPEKIKLPIEKLQRTRQLN